jgi:hypothetical protein
MGNSSWRELANGGATGGRPVLDMRAGDAFINCDCDDASEQSMKCSRIRKLSHAFFAASICHSCLTYKRKYLKRNNQDASSVRAGSITHFSSNTSGIIRETLDFGRWNGCSSLLL